MDPEALKRGLSDALVELREEGGRNMDSDRLRRLMRDLGDAVIAYQQGHGFLGIENLPDEIEQLGDASYVRHAREMREALKRKDDSIVLSELILVLAKLEQQRG